MIKSRFVLAALAVVSLSACRSSAPVFTAVPPDPALAVPGPVVLTVVNAQGRQTTFTRAGLAALGLVTFTTPDPSRKNEAHTYVGPLLSRALEASGVQSDATLHLVAHDRYTFDLKLAALKDVPIIMALKGDGQTLELRDFGPVYLTLPYHAVKLDPNLYNGAWVWQLMRIEERPAAP
ncbi:hypothetical protein GCM10008959_28330 [Deinococcus seoulensis]|uniref:Molybdopterin-dependent oxidoreductase n=2 Tax=Deinococcus TaxID=1298 RepID=A0ABQ2RX21_9DEIO|nr:MULTISPECIES: hypothetical protein [Deinococcus]GGR64502.1 hypothetical protein GCM10008959_28330 [Deinococcus seoulensis]GGS21950.1 hypothetical protein GCM10008961_11770 [Deinococcus knuensis]